MAQVHPLLTRAKALCEAFTVKRCERGLIVWRFRDWSHAKGGWTREAYASSPESAERQLLSRFPDLTTEEPEAEQPTEVPADAYFDCGGFA